MIAKLMEIWAMIPAFACRLYWGEGSTKAQWHLLALGFLERAALIPTPLALTLKLVSLFPAGMSLVLLSCCCCTRAWNEWVSAQALSDLQCLLSFSGGFQIWCWREELLFPSQVVWAREPGMLLGPLAPCGGDLCSWDYLILLFFITVEGMRVACSVSPPLLPWLLYILSYKT